MSMLKKKMVNSEATPLLKQMTTYEWCMKVNVVVTPSPPY